MTSEHVIAVGTVILVVLTVMLCSLGKKKKAKWEKKAARATVVSGRKAAREDRRPNLGQTYRQAMRNQNRRK